MPPFGFFDYVTLQKNALTVISDSGTITEETDILNLNSITIRNEHERPEGMDAGTLIMSGLNSEDVLNSVKVILDSNQEVFSKRQRIDDYQVENISKKMVKIVYSYTGFINRNVWGKI